MRPDVLYHQLENSRARAPQPLSAVADDRAIRGPVQDRLTGGEVGGLASVRSFSHPASSLPMAQLIDGKALAAAIRSEVTDGVTVFLTAHGRRPSLRVVLVGDNPASQSYVRGKARFCR